MKKRKISKEKFKKALSVVGSGVEKICNNCRLYNREEGNCRVVVLYEGQRYNLPVNPGDSCFFDTEFIAIREVLVNDEVVRKKETFNAADEIKQARFWVEDPLTGKPTRKKKGVVKIEYDKDFFGKGDE